MTPALSPHLFWDVDAATIDWEKKAGWIAQRVLEYGKWSDWQAIVKLYGRPRLRELVTSRRSLDPRVRAFCQAWLQIPKAASRCSTKTAFR